MLPVETKKGSPQRSSGSQVPSLLNESPFFERAAETLLMNNLSHTSETRVGQPSVTMIPQESESVKGSDEKLSDRTDYSELRANLEDTYLIDVGAILALAEIYLSNYGGDLTKTQFRVQFLSIANNLAKAIDTANQTLFNTANNELLSLAEEIVTAHKDVGETAESLRAIKKHLATTKKRCLLKQCYQQENNCG